MSSHYSSSNSNCSSNPSTYSNSLASPGLPADEFKHLRKMQDRSRLEAHFRHSGSSTTTSSFSHPQTAYQNHGISQDRRVRISQVRHATRAALGPSFDFTDSYEPPQRIMDRHREERYEDPIPQKYLDEYHRWCREDDLKYDRVAHRDDYSFNAPARMHEPVAAYEMPLRSRMGCRNEVRIERPSELVPEAPRLSSKFSFDSESSGEERQGSWFSRVGKGRGRR